MYVTREEVKVYKPDEGKAIKLTQNGKLIMYMVTPYYELPNYNYEVEEVDIEEAKTYLSKGVSKVKKFIKTFKR